LGVTIDKSHVVHPDFIKLWGNYAEEFSFKLVVPEVVRGEILFQQCTSAIKSMKKATEFMRQVESITEQNYFKTITESEIKERVTERFDKWLKSIGGKVAETPLKGINWKKVIDKSIWRKPPFIFDPKNPDLEKGFRDFLILEAVLLAAWKEGGTRRFFLCKDKLLAKAAKQGSKYLETYESIDSFESYLKLVKEELEEKFINSILKRAAAKFFSKKDINCLYYRENVESQLKKKYKQYIEDPTMSFNANEINQETAPKNWIPVNRGSFSIQRPKFMKLEAENIYHWETDINFVRQYTRKPDSDFEIRSPMLSVEEQPQYEDYRVLFLTFKIQWKAQVRTNRRFYDLSIEKLKLHDNLFKVPLEH
jgi:hypothetical protein